MGNAHVAQQADAVQRPGVRALHVAEAVVRPGRRAVKADGHARDAGDVAKDRRLHLAGHGLHQVHGLGGRGKEMGPVFPGWLRLAAQSKARAFLVLELLIRDLQELALKLRWQHLQRDYMLVNLQLDSRTQRVHVNHRASP